MTTSIAAVQPRVTIDHWPSERPLLAVSLPAAALLWVVLLDTAPGMLS